MRTIMFVFGGRKPNIELALPFYKRILDENPDVEIHLWDLARDVHDSRYMRTLTGIDRFTVRTEFYQGNGRAMSGQNRVWNHYTNPEYQDCVFVKADDDVVFYDTDRFKAFRDSITADDVTSALTINNGASTRHIPPIWELYEQLNIPLLDVHLSADYAELSHRWFFDNWQTLTAGGNPVRTEEWVSINCIGYTHNTGKRIAGLLGTRPPREIAGRFFTPRNRVGDEGAVNMLPRLIHTGFTVAHLNFGPQTRSMDDALYADLRKQYADIGKRYLSHDCEQIRALTTG